MNAEQWNAASVEDRKYALRRGFPFDYLMYPTMFVKAAELPYEQLPANVKTGIKD